MNFLSPDFTAKNTGQVFGHLDFKIVVEPSDAPALTIVLLAPSRQEKAAWTSDISQVGIMRTFIHPLSVTTCPIQGYRGTSGTQANPW